VGAVTAKVSADGTLVVSQEELRRAGIGPGAVVTVASGPAPSDGPPTLTEAEINERLARIRARVPALANFTVDDFIRERRAMWGEDDEPAG
jgi:hypothetical protein